MLDASCSDRRVWRSSGKMSFTSSAVRSNVWSIFSSFSLAEVSIISVIALPLYLQEISNVEFYKPTGLDATEELVQRSGDTELPSVEAQPLTISATNNNQSRPLS